MNNHVESYKHRYAKQTLAEWLQSTVDYGRSKGYYPFRYSDLSWVPKPGCPNRGVFQEYPIMYRYLNDNTVEYLGVNPGWSEIPDIEKMIANGLKVGCILDVAICDQNGLRYGLEIEHRHATEAPKIDLLRQISESVQPIEIYELSADWVLNQVRRPKALDYKRLV